MSLDMEEDCNAEEEVTEAQKLAHEWKPTMQPP